LSNSKHSLFDHFKRNLDSMSRIPKFDTHTGILTSKDKKRPSDQKTPMAPIKIKRQQYELSLSESEHSTESPYATSSNLSTYSIASQYQTDNQQENYLTNQMFIQYQPQQDDYYYDSTMMHYYSTNQDYLQHEASLPVTQASLPIEMVDSKPEYFQLINVQSKQWNDDATLVDSISPLVSTYPTLPSFNTFLNA
jgi:hypothetical protein